MTSTIISVQKAIRCVFILVMMFPGVTVGQDRSKDIIHFVDEPILVDSTTTIFFPVRYNNQLMSDNKIAFFGDYYANIVVYDIASDTYKKLFRDDCYIEPISERYSSPFRSMQRHKNTTRKWIFMLVKNRDYSGNGRIDEHDPSILFVTTLSGDSLRALTEPNENVVSFQLYELQNFGLIKFQRDHNNDKAFKSSDRDFYYRKIDLTTLVLGQAIQMGGR